jgi:acid stress-induced BolA-like protein IbaG/YrbA
MNITSFLKSQFPEADISFDGEDCNSKVLIISKEFEGLTTLKRHKLVLGALKDHFKTGELHALSLNTKAPSEMS